MRKPRSFGVLLLVPVLLVLAACASGSHRSAPGGAGADDDITVGSFNFQESVLLAEIYSQALEAGGFHVRRAYDLGTREFVEPALATGLVQVVPEYAGSALQFWSLGAQAATSDAALTHARLSRLAAAHGLVALDPAAAQDANAFVVTRQTARRFGLRALSDLGPVARQLTFGGPPECLSRPLCLLGLQRVYGVRFKELVRLDTAGPVTLQALEHGNVDLALLFTTDPAIGGSVVELADDRRLQPAENVTPLVRRQVIDRWGSGVVTHLDLVSGRLTTTDLRHLNALIASGKLSVAAVAKQWLTGEGLR
jgi:osmoprotectant transport system substrate-binding protein